MINPTPLEAMIPAMTPHIQASVPAPVLAVFRHVQDVHARIGELPPLATCHAVCRAFAAVIPQLSVRDGYFSGSYTHAWCKVVGYKAWIIDVYPWATVGGPILVSLETMSPWVGLYRPADEWLLKTMGSNLTGLVEAHRAVSDAWATRSHPAGDSEERSL